MKTLTIAMITMSILSAPMVGAQEYKVDTQSSTLKWHGKKVTGEHYGYITIKEGWMKMDDDRIMNGRFVIDMNTITNTDLASAEYNQKLVNHLKSDDFFGVEKHPEAILEIKKSTPFDNNEATVEAMLTIKNITHPITFKATRTGDAYMAEIVVDRSKYDVRYGSGSFFDNLGDRMIYDNFTMTVKVNVNEITPSDS